MKKFHTLLLLLFAASAFAGEPAPSSAGFWSAGDLTRPLSKEEAPQLLEDWRWLIGTDNKPIVITTMGDAFVRNEKTGVVGFVDTLEGKLKPVANSLDAFYKRMNEDKEFVDEYFSTQLLQDARIRGLKVGVHQVYSFKRPPVLGGPQTVENLEATDLAVHFSVLGQIFRQVRDLPPGAKIKQLDLQ
jgi:hypothetical protein